jgi:3-methyladenine DNA glycosylase AlkD
MERVNQIKKELNSFGDNKKGKGLYKFFQVFPGGYGEGDKFIGVTVPNQRIVSKKHYKSISLNEIEVLLSEPVHEYRLTALFMLVLKYQKAKDEEFKEDIVTTYLKQIERVNNWDLVDSSAHLILGPHLVNRDKGLLYELAISTNLWVQRIAIISTYHFIKANQFNDTLRVSKMLLNHEHDLIHKAVGWMLREIGKRDFEVEYYFLTKNYKQMPRTMLRYAIEKFPEDIRQRFLKGEIER